MKQLQDFDMTTHPNVELNDLQWFQYLHDSHYHLDIFHLRTQEKLSHLLKHLYKYNQSEVTVHHHTYFADSLACLFSMANTLGCDIAEALKTHDILTTTIDGLPSIFASEYISSGISGRLGKISKDLEGIDHLEARQYRTNMVNNITGLLILVVQLYREQENTTSLLGLVQCYVRRLDEVKKKNLFFSRIHSTLIGTDQCYQSFYRLMEL